jgi:hypothetical protein
MAEAVSRRPLTVEASVWSRTSSCEIWGRQSGIGKGFFFEYFGFPQMLLLSEGQADEAWEPLNKAVLFRTSESIGQEGTFKLFLQIFKLPSVLL